jgi:hypothetical protein
MTYNSTTTLKRIRAAGPCEDGWCKLLAHLGKTKADDEPLDLLTVLDSNGIDDALWVLSYAMPDDRLARHFQAWCAEQVLHLFEAQRPADMRVRDQIAMLRNDSASAAAGAAAGAAAWAAAGDAARKIVPGRMLLTEDCLICAEMAAAGDAAWDAARAAQGKQLRKMIGGIA